MADHSVPPPAPRPGFSVEVSPSRLNPNRDHPIDVIADAPARAAVAAVLDLIALPKLRLTGTLRALPGNGWRFEGDLGATAVQACVVTLEPVKTRIDIPVRRSYLPGAAAARTMTDIEIHPEAEADDEIDPLTDPLDLGTLAIEELSLALPTYPRAPGAPARDDTPEVEGPPREKPFGALAALREKMREDGD